MCLIFCLADILTQFRPLFNRQNFDLFCTFIVGLITHQHRATVTGIYPPPPSDPNVDAPSHTVDARIFGIFGTQRLILTTNGIQLHL